MGKTGEGGGEDNYQKKIKKMFDSITITRRAKQAFQS